MTPNRNKQIRDRINDFKMLIIYFREHEPPPCFSNFFVACSHYLVYINKTKLDNGIIISKLTICMRGFNMDIHYTYQIPLNIMFMNHLS